MIRLTEARNAEWNTNQEMRGHTIAVHQLEKTVEMLKKYTKSAAQKKLAKIAFVDSTDWHYWANYISDKYIAMVQYALRRAGKGKDLAVLCNIDQKHPMWKTDFLRYLEYLAAKNDYKDWVKAEIRARRYYMPIEEATRRVDKYHTYLMEKFS